MVNTNTTITPCSYERVFPCWDQRSSFLTRRSQDHVFSPLKEFRQTLRCFLLDFDVICSTHVVEFPTTAVIRKHHLQFGAKKRLHFSHLNAPMPLAHPPEASSDHRCGFVAFGIQIGKQLMLEIIIIINVCCFYVSLTFWVSWRKACESFGSSPQQWDCRSSRACCNSTPYNAAGEWWPDHSLKEKHTPINLSQYNQQSNSSTFVQSITSCTYNLIKNYANARQL